MKPFTTIAVIVFSLMGFIHFLRLFFGWEIVISGMILPLWISAPGFAIASGLAWMLWREISELRTVSAFMLTTLFCIKIFLEL